MRLTGQINNNLTSQAATMQLNGVPNDIVQNLDPLAVLILIPIHEIIIWPGLRRLGVSASPRADPSLISLRRHANPEDHRRLLLRCPGHALRSFSASEDLGGDPHARRCNGKSTRSRRAGIKRRPATTRHSSTSGRRSRATSSWRCLKSACRDCLDRTLTSRRCLGHRSWCVGACVHWADAHRVRLQCAGRLAGVAD